MTKYKITAPVRHVVSTIAGVAFADSVGYTDNPGALAYFRRQGYRVDEVADEPDAPAPAETDKGGGQDDQPKKPSKGASKADWVAYATTHGGMTEADAEAMTRDALAERFADKKEGDGQ